MPKPTDNKSARRTLLLACALAAVAPTAARAQQVPTAATASRYQKDIADWLQSFVGPKPKLPRNVVTVAPEGDHYAFRLTPLKGTDLEEFYLAGIPTGNGRWALSPAGLPSPVKFAINLTKPDGAAERIAYDAAYQDQRSSTMLDTSFATPSTSTSSLDGLTLTTTKPTGPETTTVTHASSETSIAPTGGDRVTVSQTLEMAGYDMTAAMKDEKLPVRLTFGRILQRSSISDVSRGALHAMSQGAVKAYMDAMAPANAKRSPPVPPMEAAVKVIMQLLPTLLRGISVDEALEDVTATVGGNTVGVRHLSFSFGGLAADGNAKLQIGFGLDGMTLPPLPPEIPVALIPTRFGMRASVDGLATDRIAAVLNYVSETNQAPKVQVNRLLTAGGVTGSVSDVVLDVADAHLTGSVAFAIVSPTLVRGSGQVRATNLDGLQRQLTGDPELAQAGILLAFAKGLARIDGEAMVWDLLIENQRIMVNGQDVIAMLAAQRRKI